MLTALLPPVPWTCRDKDTALTQGPGTSDRHRRPRSAQAYRGATAGPGSTEGAPRAGGGEERERETERPFPSAPANAAHVPASPRPTNRAQAPPPGPRLCRDTRRDPAADHSRRRRAGLRDAHGPSRWHWDAATGTRTQEVTHHRAQAVTGASGVELQFELLSSVDFFQRGMSKVCAVKERTRG